MRFLTGLLISLMLALATGVAHAQEIKFAHKGVQKDAERYEAYLNSNWRPGKDKAADLRVAGEKMLGADPRGASGNFARAAVADGKDPFAWIGLAKALLAIKADPDKGAERYDLPVNASGAAYIAYQRAKEPAVKARALAVLGDAMQRRSYWRPAIEAFRASLSIVDNALTRETFDKLRAEHGFRMTDYKTEADATSPRVCVQFSENLARGNVDFGKFVSVNGRDPQGVSPEGQQLCVEGLQHGERYEIQIRAELPSDVNETLPKAVTVAVYVPDRKPFVRFSGRSYVLPSRGQQGIPLVTVNTDKISVEVYRVGDRNLSGVLKGGEIDRQLSSYDLEQLQNETGAKVYEGGMDVATKLNDEVTTAFPVSEAVGALKPGVYVMIARPEGEKKDYENQVATQWFIVSDLGLTALTGEDGVHAFVRSLAETKPMGDVNVKLVARNNEVLASAKTDAKGYARFEGGIGRGEGGLQPAILVAESSNGEYAFLDLTTSAFDLTDRGVKGREPPGPLDGFLYTERGVYRPGEEVNLTALVRDASGKAAGLPVTLIVTRPDGVEHRRMTMNDQGLGGRATTLTLGGSAMTGTWRAKLHADPKAEPIAQVSFLVEDFTPERLDMTLTPSAGALATDGPKQIDVVGRYLYGPPGANLGLEGEIVVKQTNKDVEGWPGFKFGMADEKFEPVRNPLEGLPDTDSDGKAKLNVLLPQLTKTARPLEATVIVKLRETGGRTIERSVQVPVDLKSPRIGIKPQFSAESVGEGETASFDIVQLDAESKLESPEGLRWELVRLESNWQWYSRDGSWNYESQTLTRRVATGTLDAGTANVAKITAKVDYGRYRLDITSADKDGPAASYAFNAGWYTGESSVESPEMLDVALDKATYKPGETAKVRIASKQGGKALIAVLGNELLSATEVEIGKGGGDVEIQVGDNWGPGAYVTAMLYRPMDEQAKRMPSRAVGVRWLGLDQTSRTLKVSVETEAKVKSGATLSVPVKVSGLAAGEEARITVAAVDLGILNLTRYQIPAPETWFYAQRKLGFEVRDFYGRLIDGMRAERGKLRVGGDASDEDGMQGSPPVEELVAFFSGIVKVGADGTAKAEFALPDFNGTVRVMAVAWSADKLGHGTADVIVRDAVALTASGPRFLTLGDEARLELDVHNVEGPQAKYAITVDSTVDGSATPTRAAEKALDLKTGERKSERVAVKPADVGLFTYDVRVTGPDGIDVKRRLTFDVKPPAGDIKRTTVSQLAGKGGKITLSPDLATDLIKSRTRINLSVGPAARLDVPAMLSALDRYPYGCAEQTVSRALPLVYANAVAAGLGIAEDKALRERVQGAVDRVFEMQDYSGAFGVWGPYNPDLWLTSYVTDFLTRAKETGYVVKPSGFTQALDRLQNFVSNSEDFEKGGEAQAYALYVLARNGRAPIGELRYYVDERLSHFATPLSKAQLGAALAMMGDTQRAETAFKLALSAIDEKSISLARHDYGSTLRDGAALVTLAAETGIAKMEAPRLVDVIAKAYLARTYTSTQEQAWMLLAAKALGDQAKSASLAINGKPVTGALQRSLSVAEVEAGAVTVTNEGEAPVDAVISVIGAALTPEPPASKGFKIERSYYSLDGTKLDLASATGGKSQVKQNDRFVAVVKIESDEAGGRVLLVDRLPAGFEIENPRLVDSGDIRTLDWLKTSVKPEHTEFRDDRFVAAFNFFGNSKSSNDQENDDASNDQGNDSEEETSNAETPKGPVTTATVAYIVRAVTPGTFIHPAATVEDMYRPERYARSAAGSLAVTAKE